MDVATLNDPYSKDSIQLTNIKKCVQMQDADMMIVIYNDQSDIGIIKSEFLIFDSSFEIQYVNDNQLEPDDIKILVYKGSFANVGVGENNAVSGRIKCVQHSEKFS